LSNYQSFEQRKREAKAKRALDRLESFPGMTALKAQIEQIVHFAKISKLRESHGLKAEPHSNHMVFTGNPGTGKTTAARLIGEAFVALGFITSDRDNAPFVEVHQADVAHPHVGQSEQIIKAKFAEAKGGVLFIDEVYSLAVNSEHGTEKKIIAAIVQLMEDMRNEVIVIVAGYPKEMQQFLSFNPGMRSRFSSTIHFAEYSTPDLIKVAAFICEEREYEMSAEYKRRLVLKLDQEKKRPGFGNARTVRNILEQSIKLQSVRVLKLNSPKRADLVTLAEQDIELDMKSIVSERDALKRALLEIQHQLEVIDMEEMLG
jgi:stage V sporulation protein K